MVLYPVISQKMADDADKTLDDWNDIKAMFAGMARETLPVLESPSDRKVIGYLTEQYALRRYNQELERRRGADLGQQDLFSIAEPPR